MTPAEIRSRLPLAPQILSDASYAVPTLRYLQGPFWDSFKAERWAKGFHTWKRRNDCGNFARAYAQHAQDCHAISTGSESEALAVGEFFYHSAALGPHAIVIAFVDAEARLAFIEPQNGQELQLTPAEFSSCFFVRF